MITVLHIINDLSSGGAERLVAQFVIGMNREGVKADILLLRRGNSVYEEFLVRNGFSIQYLTERGNIYNPLIILKIIPIIKKYKIVHAHLFPSQYWVTFASFFVSGRIKFITTEHNTSNKRMNSKLFYLTERIVYSRYNKIVCISKKTREALANWLPYLNNRLIVIENGVDIAEISQVQPYNREDICDGQLKKKDILIVMVARFTAQKDHSTLIEAVSHLPVDYKLILIGEGELVEDVKEKCRIAQIEDRVFFLGFRSDVARILKAVDVCILSSNWEGFGLVAIESMAAGIPIIASNVDGLNDVVRDAGVLFERGNVNELVEKIKLLVTDSVKRHEIIERQYKRCTIYDLKECIEKYLNLYYQVIKGNNYNSEL